MKKSLITFGILASCGLIALVIAQTSPWDSEGAGMAPVDAMGYADPNTAGGRAEIEGKMSAGASRGEAWKEYQRQGGTLDVNAWFDQEQAAGRLK